MARNMIQYRGSLKSCNYGCSYCPFAKRPSSPSELLKDREDWMRFVGHLETQGEPYGAVMVVPYGEALIHDYYWEGLARLSRMGTMDAVGAQTNVSFDIDRQLTIFKENGGRKEKLRVWATFHPEMTTVPLFAEQCRKLLSAGIRVCAGAVGVPENLETLRRLKEALPGGCCLWINRMDGLNRRYTEEEQQAFLRIDPWFYRELHVKKAMPEQCPGRLFVESDGRMRRCTISAPPEGNWYDTGGTETLPCRKKACTCYLAYGGRMDCEERTAFGRWPLFRIPWSPRAVFLDLDGTLIPKNGRAEDRLLPQPGISGEWMDFFKRESRTRSLFLATSLPWKEAAANAGAYSPIYQEVSLQEARMWSFGQGMIRQGKIVQRKTTQGTTGMRSSTPSTPPGSLSSRRFSPTSAFASASLNTKAVLISLHSRDRRNAAGGRKR